MLFDFKNSSNLTNQKPTDLKSEKTFVRFKLTTYHAITLKRQL